MKSNRYGKVFSKKSFMNMIDRVWKPFRQAMAGGSQESVIKVLEELGKDICGNDKD